MGLSIVIGAYQFIGFHLCKHLLEQGNEVLGVDWNQDTAPGNIIEEKQLEFGRNANFSFTPLVELENINISDTATIYISWYDVNKESPYLDQDIDSRLQAFLHTLQGAEREERPRIVIIYPLGSIHEEINYEADKIIYLPTIYGPWQHERMAFEQGVRNKSETDIKSSIENEYTSDAIYITDFLESFEDIVAVSEKMVLVISAAPDQWSLAARELFDSKLIKEIIHRQPAAGKQTGAHVYYVKNIVTPERGINLQKQHYRRLELLGQWKTSK
jgi:hypothetical protein